MSLSKISVHLSCQNNNALLDLQKSLYICGHRKKRCIIQIEKQNVLMGAFTENLEQEMWQQFVEPIYSEVHQF